MTRQVQDLVRAELKHAEKTLHHRLDEVEKMEFTMTQLNGRCADLNNKIEEYTNGLKQIGDELDTTRNQLSVLADARRDVENQCVTLQSQIDSYREHLGQR